MKIVQKKCLKCRSLSKNVWSQDLEKIQSSRINNKVYQILVYYYSNANGTSFMSSTKLPWCNSFIEKQGWKYAHTGRAGYNS